MAIFGTQELRLPVPIFREVPRTLYIGSLEVPRTLYLRVQEAVLEVPRTLYLKVQEAIRAIELYYRVLEAILTLNGPYYRVLEAILTLFDPIYFLVGRAW